MAQIRLAARFGRALRALREAKGLRQDDVARAARSAGLPWTRSVVVLLEVGRRFLTLDEFLDVPVLFRHLGLGDQCAVRLESDGRTARFVVEPLGIDDPVTFDDDPAWAAGREQLRWLFGPAPRVGPPGSAEAVAENQAVLVAASGDLESKVARQAQLDPFRVAWVAHRLWGGSISAERDRRVAEQAPAETAPRALQALRGHVTRALLAELAPALADVRRRQQATKKRTAARRKKG